MKHSSVNNWISHFVRNWDYLILWWKWSKLSLFYKWIHEQTSARNFWAIGSCRHCTRDLICGYCNGSISPACEISPVFIKREEDSITNVNLSSSAHHSKCNTHKRNKAMKSPLVLLKVCKNLQIWAQTYSTFQESVVKWCWSYFCQHEESLFPVPVLSALGCCTRSMPSEPAPVNRPDYIHGLTWQLPMKTGDKAWGCYYRRH